MSAISTQTKALSGVQRDVHYTLFLDSTLNLLRILNGWAHLDGGHIIGKGLMRGFERW